MLSSSENDLWYFNTRETIKLIQFWLFFLKKKKIIKETKLNKQVDMYKIRIRKSLDSVISEI